MKKATRYWTIGAFIGGGILAGVSVGIEKYRIDIPVKRPQHLPEEILCLEDVTLPHPLSEAFTQEEKTVLLNKLKKAKLPCKIVGLPEPIYELPMPDYTVRAVIPFYDDSFHFYSTGELINAELCNEDSIVVSEIISKVARRLKNEKQP